MKKLIIILLSAVICVAPGCSKKESGVCYCSYFSGDKTHYDLQSLSRDKQQDSCTVIDRNAGAFGGDCTLK